MSMTTLGAQLAALNGSSVGGSVLPTSRRHEDAVGRGLHHSVQVGHSLSTSSKSQMYKASILYETAREASNVPLSTLQENSVAALEELAAVDPYFGTVAMEVITNKKNMERGLLTKQENEELDETVIRLFFRLGIHMTNTELVTPGLNVVEYMIRALDLHLRPKLVSTVLLVWLPHHENAYFLRWLQLVDLASVQTYSWLRPYAIPNAKVGRDVIAKAVSKNLALCRDILQLATKAAYHPNADATLSFTAAVLVEAISLQHRSGGSLDERTGKALLPVIRRACQSAHRNPLWANWGYVMASTLVETSCLADGPRKGLVISVLRGISTNPRSGDEEEVDGDIQMDDGAAVKTVAEHDTTQTALIVVMSLLQQQPPVAVAYPRDTEQEETDSMLGQLVVVGDKETSYGYNNTSIINDTIVWKCMLHIDGLASRLAELLVDDGFLDVVNWVASLWVVGWRLAEKARNLESNNQALECFLLDLHQNEKLSQHLWSKPEWVEAVTFFVLANINLTIHAKEKSKIDAHSLLQIVLKSLRQRSVAAYEHGVARALLRLKRQARSELADYLGFTTSSKAAIGTTASTGNAALPPRVALDHDDIEIRLDAIDRLVSHDEDEDIVIVLQKRVLTENELDVATKAIDALFRLMNKKSKSKKSFDHKQILGSETFAEDVLESLYKWTERSDSSPHLICHLIALTSMSASKILEAHGINQLFVKLLEGVMAFLFHDCTDVRQESADGIMMALVSKKGTKTSNSEACVELMSHGPEVLEFLYRDDEEMSATESYMRRCCIPAILKGYYESAGQNASNVANECLDPARDYCLWVLRMYGSSLSLGERKQLLGVLKKSTSEGVKSRNRLFVTLSTVLAYDGVLLDEVISPFVVHVCENVRQKNGEQASSIAVMMELALRPDTNNDAIEKLIAIADGVVSSQAHLCHFGLTYSLSLLAHSEPSVRKAAVSLTATIGDNLMKSKNSDIKALAEICSYVTKNESSAVMGTHAFLTMCLREVAVSSACTGVVDLLLKLILCAMLAHASSTSLYDVSKVSASGFLDFENAIGGHVASLALMGAAQSAGESAFPLMTRWSLVANPTFRILLQDGVTTNIPSTMSLLLEHLVTILKGMKTTTVAGLDSSTVIIMSGPGVRGGRNRSYSFGKGDTSSFVHPYPKDMSAAIIALIASRGGDDGLKHARHAVSRHILSSLSWGEHVFQRISQSVRQQIVSAILESIVDDHGDATESVFFLLPLSCDDVADLLKKKQGLVAITYLADFTNTNAKRLASGNSIVEVIVVLLEIFTELSRGDASADEGIDFARKSILNALTEIFQASSSNKSTSGLNLDKMKNFDAWVKSLVGVINPKDASLYRPLDSTRSKQSTLSVLTYLCTLYPDVLIDQLVPAIAFMASSAATEKDAALISEMLRSVVPVYLDLASKARLTALKLMKAFISACSEGDSDATQIRLYQGFVDAVSGYGKPGEGDLLGSFVSCCLAGNLWSARRSGISPWSASTVQQIVGQVSVSKRVQATLTIVSYARDAVSLLGGEEIEEKNISVPFQSLLKVAVLGPDSTEKKSKAKQRFSDDNIIELCRALMGASCEVMSSPAFARYLRHSNTESSESVVRLWQDLLFIQSMCKSKLGASEGKTNSSWSMILDIVNETLESIQKHLPSPIFLAFATSLVRESDSEDLRARALQLVSDRALQLDPMNTESYLFMDMLPFLTSLVDKEEGMIVGPAALVTIEHITRKICVENVGLGGKYTEIVAKALLFTADLLENQSRSLNLATGAALDGAHLQLLCTASLCAATSVRACGARALPSLPKLLRPSFQLFGDANSVLADLQEDGNSDNAQLRILQLSSLRLISAVVETIPQFLSPYLGSLLRPTVLSSPSLRQTHNDHSCAVSAAAAKLREMIALKIPARQLLGPLSDAILSCESSAGVTSIVNIMTMSIEQSKPSELGGNTNSIVQVGTFVYDFASKAECSNDLILLATDMLMALVLKLSEIQLRSLYAKLRSWCGNFDKERPTIGSSRRYCFWFFSSSLASQIKSIYLPCFTTVFSDAVDELVRCFSSDMLEYDCF